jgi:hypothetical protein
MRISAIKAVILNGQADRRFVCPQRLHELVKSRRRQATVANMD